MKGVILAGGSGTRLWPLSRELYPKQFLCLTGEKSLLQQTVERTLKYLDEVIIVTNKNLYFQVWHQVKDLGISKDSILIEPTARSTAPAIALASVFLGEGEMLVLPSDHIIGEDFYNLARKARPLAEKYLVTFGVKPSYPATGYGYIKPSKKLENGYEVERFIEKPSKKEATKLIKENCFWNSGIFLFSIPLLIEEFMEHLPEIGQYLNSYEEMLQNYEKLPNISIDYGIMEKSKKVAVVPYAGKWLDIGSWESVYRVLEKDEKGNAVKGDVIALETEGSLIYGDRRIISAIGVKDMLIVDTEDALLVAKKEKSQEVKQVFEELRRKGRGECKLHRTVYKPWGYYTTLEENERYKVKRLCIYPGKSISLQMHFHRAEHWIVVKGTAKITKGEEVIYLHENESIYVPKTTKHRVENPGRVDLHIIEIQTGEYLGEDDIVRFEDEYGRV